MSMRSTLVCVAAVTIPTPLVVLTEDVGIRASDGTLVQTGPDTTVRS